MRLGSTFAQGQDPLHRTPGTRSGRTVAAHCRPPGRSLSPCWERSQFFPPTVQGMPLVPQRLLEGITESLSDDDLGLLLLIRHFERKLLDLFGQGLVQGTTHTCLGQEYVPVALAPLLDERDYVFSNHRGHGHYLARFRDPYGLLAEILGREGAVCGGVGGSQHILSGRYLSTGIQGESLPVATGVALRLRDAEPGALALAYIGDGTWGEGAV